MRPKMLVAYKYNWAFSLSPSGGPRMVGLSARYTMATESPGEALKVS